MVGQHCNIGTNFFNVLLNEEEFIENFRGNLKVKTTKKEIDLKDLKTIDITNDDFDSKIDITDQYQLPKKELPKLSKTIPSTKKDSATKKDTNKNTIMSDVVEKNTEKIGKIGNTENDEDDKEGDNKEGDDEEEPVKKKETKTKTKVEKEKVVKKKPVIKKIKK
jgi:hypothetical protein